VGFVVALEVEVAHRDAGDSLGRRGVVTTWGEEVELRGPGGAEELGLDLAGENLGEQRGDGVAEHAVHLAVGAVEEQPVGEGL
jgi:hypothetical protein